MKFIVSFCMLAVMATIMSIMLFYVYVGFMLLLVLITITQNLLLSILLYWVICFIATTIMFLAVKKERDWFFITAKGYAEQLKNSQIKNHSF